MRALIATDGSEDAKRAAQWFQNFPLPEGSSILVLSVATMPAVPGMPSKFTEAVHRQAQQAAEETRVALGARGTGAEIRVVDGDAREGIVSAADTWDADLVVVGARGLGRIGGFLLGTVSRAVARECSRPVLVVKGTRRRLRSVVVAIDGSDNALEAVRFLAALPLPAAAQLHLVGVVETVPLPATAPRAIRAQLKAAAQAVERERRQTIEAAVSAASDLLRAASRVPTRLLSTGTAAVQILRLAGENSADLVVVGARGLGAMKRLLLGSVSEEVLRESRCPVLIVKRPQQ